MFKALPYRWQVKAGLCERPHYAHCLWNAADLARRLGHRRMSVLELGVAGGNGLVAIERHVRAIERLMPIEIEIYGFDTAAGLPPPADYRDIPFHWQPGFFRMDRAALEKRLSRAKLVIGNVSETCRTFFQDYRPAPVGCIFHDLDYYSSTRDSFALFEGPREHFLPRVFNYFDDIVGTEVSLFSDFAGERLAIEEFNRDHADKKIARVYYFAGRRFPREWHHKIFVYHDFQHPQYATFVSGSNQQLPLAGG